VIYCGILPGHKKEKKNLVAVYGIHVHKMACMQRQPLTVPDSHVKPAWSMSEGCNIT
jgi:hypothetical protein